AIVRKKDTRAQIAAVVVSAMSGVTDQLIELAVRAAQKDRSYRDILKKIGERHVRTVKKLVGSKRRAHAQKEIEALMGYLREVATGVELVQELSPGALDYIVSYGERLSAHVLHEALLDRGVACEYLNAREIITTDDNFGEAVVDFRATNRAIARHFKTHKKLQVVTGFIASTAQKKTTTLGRGGSDYTASILGAALNASVIEIWTDVSGVYTADPRKVPGALPIKVMSYEEAVEMSYFGAKVIHPPTMAPAMQKKIPILIKNTFEPEKTGTVIGTKTESNGLVKGISSIGDLAVLLVEGSGLQRIRGASGRVFGALARARVNVIMITQSSSQHSVSFAIAPKDVERAREVVEEEFSLERRSGLIGPVKMERNLSILAIVGEGMKERRGIAGRLFSTLGRNGINVIAIAQGSSELNISVVIRKEDQVKALNAVHAAFFAPDQRILNIFLIGTGVVGGALLSQIAAQASKLEREHGFSVRVAGVADVKRMHFNPAGIPPREWRKLLATSRTKSNVSGFVAAMKAMELPNSVFVDCTASQRVADAYLSVLRAGISIVTPNKCANSGSLASYRALREVAARHGVKFLYETNVGAGLPVIGTLRDLLLSGDTVEKIEAVLSGTLSYIFDNFEGEKRFSDIVRKARELGYAEPDPRNDLSGLDVARKILILAREIGLPMELNDVKVESLLSKRAAGAKNVEKFFDVLKRDDAAFEKKKRAAARERKVLRYIATLKNGKAAVRLEAVDSKHPFYALYGNDNVIAFFTDRYKKSPLIVQGPGAGADVTAAGIFADILRTASNAL
ncbi:MAG: bifunctional aspartate kinase/homoserine dehydrogenase, partial [Candidatus Parcubacteria bacterium]